MPNAGAVAPQQQPPHLGYCVEREAWDTPVSDLLVLASHNSYLRFPWQICCGSSLKGLARDLRHGIRAVELDVTGGNGPRKHCPVLRHGYFAQPCSDRVSLRDALQLIEDVAFASPPPDTPDEANAGEGEPEPDVRPTGQTTAATAPQDSDAPSESLDPPVFVFVDWNVGREGRGGERVLEEAARQFRAVFGARMLPQAQGWQVGRMTLRELAGRVVLLARRHSAAAEWSRTLALSPYDFVFFNVSASKGKKGRAAAREACGKCRTVRVYPFNVVWSTNFDPTPWVDSGATFLACNTAMGVGPGRARFRKLFPKHTVRVRAAIKQAMP